MRLAKVKINPWDRPAYADPDGHSLNVGDFVAVKIEQSNEIAEVLSFEDESKCHGCQPTLTVLRKATPEEIERQPSEEERQKMIAECKALVLKHELEMKLVDIALSLDGSKLTVAFIADGRVDFRDLVKDLTRAFNRTIRLQQIGIRDEARLCGDCGHCGKPLCCRTFLKDFMSITSEMAEAQQCEHRGSDRISGACGRLMCCLSYELKGYESMTKEMPPLGAVVNVDGRKGEVIGHHQLKRTVKVKFQEGDGRGYTIVEVDLDRNKKKQ
ncbi:stage 0 sporulation protein [Candidatus Falkowbacteria bacterium]|nr:stage 0 sporulation protein [Candidatus Falkowbacteria bacterium]